MVDMPTSVVSNLPIKQILRRTNYWINISKQWRSQFFPSMDQGHKQPVSQPPLPRDFFSAERRLWHRLGHKATDGKYIEIFFAGIFNLWLLLLQLLEDFAFFPSVIPLLSSYLIKIRKNAHSSSLMNASVTPCLFYIAHSALHRK